MALSHAHAGGLRSSPGVRDTSSGRCRGTSGSRRHDRSPVSGVNFIIPHLGSFADDWRAHQQVIDQLVRYPNVYADTSGVRRFDYIVEAIKRAGARKLLFGSDGPWLHPGLELHKIRLLGLPAEQEG
jgi:hypothetical protein